MLILSTLICFYIISFIAHDTFLENIKILSRHLIFIILPILFSMVQSREKVFALFTVGVNVCILGSIYSIILFFIDYGYLPLGNSKHVNELILLERPYFGLSCALSVIISFYLSRNTKHRVYFSISALLSIVFIFLISARISLISLIVIGTLALLGKELGKHKKTIFLIAGGIAVALFLIFGKNLSKRFYIEDSFSESFKKITIYEPRITIWDCSLKEVTNDDFNLFLGLGSFSSVTEELRKCYAEFIDNVTKKDYYLKMDFNTHNQFLDFLLSGGIFSFLLIIGFFIQAFMEAKKEFWTCSILILFLLFFLVENALHRQLGCYLFGFFLLLLFKLKKSPKNNKGYSEVV